MTIIALHQTGDLVPLLRSLLDLGLDRSLTWLLDVPYSSHPETRSAIETLGFRPGNFARQFQPTDGVYEITQRRRAAELFESALGARPNSGVRNVLVLDDGGHSALACHVFDKFAFARGQRVSIVEQTPRGVQLHRETWPDYRVQLIDVAHTAAKKQLESPVVAKTIVLETCSILAREKIVVEPDDEVLVIGHGGIGHAIGRILTTSAALGSTPKVVVRPYPEELYFRLREGRLTPLEPAEVAGCVRLVFGCTGRTSFLDDHVHLLRDRSLLVSGSSWDIEFPKDAWNHSGFLMNPGSPLHSTLRYSIGGRTILLANSGFPVNFSGNVISSPPEAMQLTVTLMLAGAVRSCFDTAPGWRGLDPAVEDWTVANYREIQEQSIPVRYVDLPLARSSP